MPIEVTIDIAPFEAMVERASSPAILEALTARVLEDDKANVPVRTGHLRDSGSVSGPGEIAYTEYYSVFVYHGTYKMAGRPWFETTKGANLGAWEQFVAQQIVGA